MMGWLAATPRPHPGTPPEQAPKVSRGEAMKQGGITPAMPEVSAPWFIEWLTELGFVEAGGMGNAPLAWTTIRAWRLETATRLRPWESRLLRKLSITFLAARAEGEDPNAQPPFYAEPAEVDQERAEMQLRIALMSASAR